MRQSSPKVGTVRTGVSPFGSKGAERPLPPAPTGHTEQDDSAPATAFGCVWWASVAVLRSAGLTDRAPPACAQRYLSTDRSPARFRNAPHACAIGYTIDSCPALASVLCAWRHMDDSIEPALPVGAVHMYLWTHAPPPDRAPWSDVCAQRTRGTQQDAPGAAYLCGAYLARVCGLRAGRGGHGHGCAARRLRRHLTPDSGVGCGRQLSEEQAIDGKTVQVRFYGAEPQALRVVGLALPRASTPNGRHGARLTRGVRACLPTA